MSTTMPAYNPQTALRTLLVGLALAGCGSKDAADDVIIPDDTDEPEDPFVGDLRVPTEIIGVANVDDDDGNGRLDYLDLNPDDNDLVPLFIESRFGPGSANSAIALSLPTALPLRVWYNGVVVLNDDLLTNEIPWTNGPAQLYVEFGDHQIQTELTVTAIDATGTPLEANQVRLTSAPLLLNHHLQNATHTWAVTVNYPGYRNDAFIRGYAEALGSTFTALDGDLYDGDVWLQDEIEFANAWTPDGDAMEVIVDSIRNRGLNRFARQSLRGPEVGVQTFGNGMANSQDSFGNLETSPPLTVGGIEYPFGRTYWGDAGSGLVPTARLTDKLDDQLVQAPVVVDVSWLCVGHVDEFISFVPDQTSPKGWRFVYADTHLAWQLLENELDPSTPLPRYAGAAGHNYATVGDMLNDQGLHHYNDVVQTVHLDPILEDLKVAFGLDESDIIRIPNLFEDGGWGCGQTGAAMIPGMVNLVVVNEPGQTSKIFTADPFIRPDRDDQSLDPFIAYVREVMPAEHEVIFLDDWQVYHKSLGEVHCGTNNRRTPVGEWWTAGAMLLGRN